MKNKTSVNTPIVGFQDLVPWGVVLIGGVVGTVVFFGFMLLGSHTAEQGVAATAVEGVAIVTEPPVIIKVDNVGCVIAEEPTLTYYVTTNTVRVTIECDSNILFNYLPAVAEETAQ